MRYIYLLAILLALPETVPAQVAIRAGRNSGRPPSTSVRAERQSAAGSDERSRGRSQQRSNDRQGDRRSDRTNDRSGGRHDQQQQQQRPTTGLSPLGLPPAQPPNQPWWERRQAPAWEQRKAPAWEQQHTPAWELTNPTRAAQKLYPPPVRGQRHDGKVRPHRNRPAVIYVLPPYRYFETGTTLSYGVAAPYVTPPPYEAPAPEPLIETGFLKLEVEPRETLQIFIDGLYLGTLADIGDELELRLGARRIELRAPGYRTLIFDTQIVPDRTIVYRGALEPISNAPARVIPAPQAPDAAPQASQASRVIYVIPGCYMGNVSPKDIKLRPGCDIGKLTTISPQ